MTAEKVRKILFEQDVEAVMRDGTVLRSNIVRPDEPGRYPVMLVRHPYGKDVMPSFYEAAAVNAARNGFVAVMQDCRHRFASGGEGGYVPFAGDAADGVDSVAWAAALPFCDGRVVMAGASYFGYTQWAAAAHAPPALKAIAPLESIGHPYRGLIFTGGALELNILYWHVFMAQSELSRQGGGESPEMVSLNADLNDMAALLARLPIGADTPGLHATRVGDTFDDYLDRDRQSPPANLAEVIASQRYENIVVPAYIVGGWYDCFAQASIDQFIGMRASAGSPAARLGTRLVMGPWAHAQFTTPLAERFFGMASSRVADFADAGQLSWFRNMLDGLPDDSAPVKIFVMGANIWRDEHEWPLARAVDTPWYLSSGGNANSRDGDGLLTKSATASPSDGFRYDPNNPVPTWGGNSLNPAYIAGPRDQAPVEARADVLVYTSEPLAHDLEVTGSPVVELWASSDAADTDFVARLVDVAPDGTAYNLCDGVIRARHRDAPLGAGPGSPIEPGRAYLYRIELWPTSNLFKAGHRIRVDITSSNFPRWSRNLNIWDDRSATLADARIASQRVFHEEGKLSRVILPVIPLQ